MTGRSTVAGGGSAVPEGRGRGRAGWSRLGMPLVTVASLMTVGALAADVTHPGLAADAPPPPAPEDVASAPLAGAGRYTLRATLDPGTHRITGTGTIELRNTSRAPLDHVFVHLYLNAFESDRTVFQRGPGEGFRGGVAATGGSIEVTRLAVPAWGDENLWPVGATTPGHPEDRTDIRVPLPRAIAPGEVVQFAVAWAAALPPVSLRTGWAGSFHMAGQWFPKIAKLEPDGSFAHFPFERLSEFYADFVDWDVRVITPATFTVGATGELVEERTEGDRVERRFVQDGVHDFAFAAWDRFEEVRAEHRGVVLRCLHPPGLEASAARQVEIARRGLDVLGARWGRYPFRTLTLVHPPREAPEAGGMEYPTLITTGGPWWSPWVGTRHAELVTVHELAHQWFQGMIASNEREHPFLDEGLTTFAETDAMDVLVPDGSSASIALGLPLATEPWQRGFAIGPARRSRVAAPSRDFATGGEYGALVYGRTSVILRTLDRVHGGAVGRALGVYARRFRFAHPTPDDLVRVVREEVGDDAAETLRRALFERGWIDVAIDDVATTPAASGGFDVAITLSRQGTLVLPVEVEVAAADGSLHRATWDGAGASTTLALHLPAAPRFARLDPEVALLLDDDLLDGAWAARPAPPVAWRSLGAGGFAARALLGLLAP